jgi:uncharacterized protein DUF1569
VKTLYEPAQVADIKQRLDKLQPTSGRLWGKMTPSQMLAHCAISMEWATGDSKPPRMFIGRILGPIVRGIALKDERPMGKNAPTSPLLVIGSEPDFSAERERLRKVVERFAAAGPGACTTHPHTFFGRLTPDEWARLMYKHLDHHLRQFGV